MVFEKFIRYVELAVGLMSRLCGSRRTPTG